MDKTRLKRLTQPNGLSCGNTVLKMVMDYYGTHQDLTIENLIIICGTNWQTGTTDVNLKMGLDYVGIPNNQSVNTNEEENLNILKENLKDNFFLMRTRIHSIPHWILVYEYDQETDTFQVHDPAFEISEYNSTDICNIWSQAVKPYDGFYTPHDHTPIKFNIEDVNEDRFIIEPIQGEDIEEVLEVLDVVFKKSGMDNKEYINGSADWDISVKMLDTETNKIVGAYVFNRFDGGFADMVDFDLGVGVQGVALGLLEEYKGLGLGKRLIDYPMEVLKLEFDFIWGLHLGNLNNADDWKKRRQIIEVDGGFVSIGLLNQVEQV